jgi:hypothetical protein
MLTRARDSPNEMSVSERGHSSIPRDDDVGVDKGEVNPLLALC